MPSRRSSHHSDTIGSQTPRTRMRTDLAHGPEDILKRSRVTVFFEAILEDKHRDTQTVQVFDFLATVLRYGNTDITASRTEDNRCPVGLSRLRVKTKKGWKMNPHNPIVFDSLGSRIGSQTGNPFRPQFDRLWACQQGTAKDKTETKEKTMGHALNVAFTHQKCRPRVTYIAIYL